MAKNAFQKAFAKVIAKAWSDPEFKAQLLKNPEATLRAQGIELPKGPKITVCESTEKEIFLVIPQQPVGNLTETQLESIAAAGVPPPPTPPLSCSCRGCP